MTAMAQTKTRLNNMQNDFGIKNSIPLCSVEFGQKILDVLQKTNIKKDELQASIPEFEELETKLKQASEKLQTTTMISKINSTPESGSIVGTLMETLQILKELQEKLNSNLLTENISKVSDDLSTNSQALIDVLVRNLFERSADVGFLSQDKDIVNALKNKEYSLLKEKFLSYIKKYSVYDNVIVLDLNNNVVASSGEVKTNSLNNNLFSDTLKTDSFIETFEKIGELTQKDDSLMFYQKILDENNKPIGVLALSFDFKGEIEKIFQDLSQDGNNSTKLLLNKNKEVIFSSDKNIKSGTQITLDENSYYQIITIENKKYICASNQANEYEGFKGLGSIGAILTPIEDAFKSDKVNIENKDILKTISKLCPELIEIEDKSIEVIKDLLRVVWNGHIFSSHSKENENFRPILTEISENGNEIKDIITNAIESLYSAILTSNYKKAVNIARLVMDIMDRNLYERANDSRWWALNKELIESINLKNNTNVTKILNETNDLYTVYNNIYVTDVNGKIIASSRNDGDLGQKSLSQANLSKISSINSSDKYTVSDFEIDVVSGEKTYTYFAKIYDKNKHIGNICIAFDSKNQFEKMINDCVPKTGNSFGLIVDNSGNIISSNSESFKIGDNYDISQKIKQLKNGSSNVEIVEIKGHYYVLGATKSNGYREYKNTDNYKNDLITLSFLDVGEIQKAENNKKIKLTNETDLTKEIQDIATFMVGNQPFGFFAKDVIESIHMPSNVKLPGYHNLVSTTIPYNNEMIPVIDLNYVLFKNKTKNKSQIIVLNTYKGKIGFIVDDLNEINHFAKDNILHTQMGYSKAFCKDNNGKLLNILDIEKILERL